MIGSNIRGVGPFNPHSKGEVRRIAVRVVLAIMFLWAALIISGWVVGGPVTAQSFISPPFTSPVFFPFIRKDTGLAASIAPQPIMSSMQTSTTQD